MNYLYDGSYEGFLTCVYRHYYGERADGIFPAEAYTQLDMLRYAMTVETDEPLAVRVLDAIEEKLSRWDAERVYRVFCSNESEKEMKILRYLQLGFKRGPKIRLLHGNPVVKDVEAAEQRLGREVHRLTGLIRFSELEGGVLFSPIEPDNDVLEFLAPHFSDRYRCDPFVIHDKVRGKALFSYDKNWRIEAFDGKMLSPARGEYGAAVPEKNNETLEPTPSVSRGEYGAAAPEENNETLEPTPSVSRGEYGAAVPEENNETLEPTPSVSCGEYGAVPPNEESETLAPPLFFRESTTVFLNGTHEPKESSPCLADGSSVLLRVSENEEDIRILWQQYFEVMAIKERVNPKLQRQFVPVRYRKHLPEFDK